MSDILVARALFKGRSHIFVDLDDGARAMLDPAEVIGRPVREVMTDPRHAASFALMDQAYRTGRSVNFEFEKDGRTGSIVIVPMLVEGQPGLCLEWVVQPARPPIAGRLAKGAVLLGLVVPLTTSLYSL